MSSTVASRRLSISSLPAIAWATVSLAAPGLLMPDAAHAQSANPAARSKAAQSLPRPQTPATGPLIGVVSLGSQKVTFYNRNGVVTQSPISTGRKGYETPEGVFSILERKEEHFSNLYDDASMPFMQRITWSGVAMHAGNLPGYAASHGCIRLPHSFAERLFGLTKLNTRIVVTQRDVAPFPITHAALFQPQLPDTVAAPVLKAPEAPAGAPATPRSAPLFKSEDGAAETPMMLGLRPGRPALPETAAPAVRPERAVTTVVEAARVQQAAATQKAAAATKAADEAKLVVRTKLVEAQKSERAAKGQDVQLRRAQGRVAALERALTLARTEEAQEKAKEAHAKAVAELESLTKAMDELKAAAIARTTEARDAQDAVKAVEAARIAAQSEARDAARRTEPVSVFVSRKAGRLYVRQGRAPMFDVPFTVKDPARAIGTHVFTAMEETPDGRGVRWTAVTVESGSAPQATPPPQSRKRGEPQAAPRPPVNPGLAVLDRLEFTKDILDRIQPYVQAGSSLVVSDLGPSIETGKGTDFVVLTRGEERAQEFIREFVAEQKRNGTRRN